MIGLKGKINDLMRQEGFLLHKETKLSMVFVNGQREINNTMV